jgi:hypothetical protein
MQEQESPIGPADAFDIVGARHDGGIDTVIVCSGPLDDSEVTLDRLALKTRNYLKEIDTDDFRQQFGQGPVRIYLACEHPISPQADQLIAALESEAAEQRVLFVQGQPGA